MKNDEIIYCPYCPEGVEMQETWSSASIADESMPYGIRHASYLHFYCPACQTFSPRAETIEDATHLALRRYQPENRVLTACEIDALDDSTPVWHEARYHSPATKWLCADFIKDVLTHSTNVYGKTWRCWLRKPTEEERKAVPWE